MNVWIGSVAMVPGKQLGEAGLPDLVLLQESWRGSRDETVLSLHFRVDLVARRMSGVHEGRDGSQEAVE